ncbi:hypothetical protein V8G54_026384 [Vigna mungo]|uniref:Alpha-N-acetylglucosaminidase n=1 Tax=Vigna mungo TaxID=3915 RepID=A0AAQ3MYN6_VIGMU
MQCCNLLECFLYSLGCQHTYYIFNCSDTFNENSPPTNDPEYISTLGAAVYKGISKGDKDAVWLMQVGDHNHDFIVMFPDWDPSTNSETGLSNTQKKINLLPPGNRRYLFQETASDKPQAHLWYPSDDVIKALQLFLAGGKNLSRSLTYRYDLVDLTRQVLSKLANQLYYKAVTSFQEKNIEALRFHSNTFLQLIKDIDVLLASDDNFLLGTWLESAKKLAVNPTNKFWSGLVESYYLPRASTYFSHLIESLRQNEKFKLIEWRKQWISQSNKWQEGNELYPVKAKGDALAISEALYEKYFAK